jgi:putative AbiEii toxin of type IV toxin-antitoxin system
VGEVYDSAHGATVRLGKRSKGFVWFFSFLAWFSQQRQKKIPLILLLDEPGLVLHASAQDDLLRYIETELKPYHQVIYTTHSPFMVDSKNFERIRIVRDRSMEEDHALSKNERGTKVFTDILEADRTRCSRCKVRSATTSRPGQRRVRRGAAEAGCRRGPGRHPRILVTSPST